MHRIKNLIIGAGPTGLGAAYRLKELGENDYLIIEQNSWVGGLAASFVDDKGFTWDIGGHVQFSHYEYFDRVMDLSLGKDGWYNHERQSWVWIRDRFVPYPFQNNIRYLPKDVAWNCLKGVIEINKQPPPAPANFEEWILAVFGRGIAEEFMLPYNFKVWAYPPAEMSYQWIGERVAVIDLMRISENIVLGKDDLSWGPNNLFRFPKQGGTGAIWQAVAGLCSMEKIRLNCRIIAIDEKEKYAEVAGGERIYFENLLTTMPLNVLVGLCKNANADIREAAGKFKYSSSNIIGIGLSGQPKSELSSKCWMYFPENNCPFYRVTLFSKYSPKNVPDIGTQFSLMTETSESAAKAVDHATLVEETIQGLVNTRLIESKDQVISTWTYRAAHGYPTPFLGRDQLVKKIIPELEKHCIYSRGRFGGWKYEVANQDHSFMQGVEWANCRINNEKESTFTL